MSNFNLVNFRKTLGLGLIALLFSIQLFAEEEMVNASIGRIGDATHLELTGLNNWKYEIKKKNESNKQILVLESKPLNTKSNLLLKTYKDELIEKVEINANGVNELTEIKIFLKKKDLDAFDYMSDQPSRWVVDIFPKDMPEAPKKEKHVKSGQNVQVAKKQSLKSGEVDKAIIDESGSDENDDESKNAADDWPAKGNQKSTSQIDYPAQTGKSNRKPSSDSLLINPDVDSSKEFALSNNLNKGAFDGGDPEFKRFAMQDYEIKENAVIASRANIYLHFPMLKVGTPELDELAKSPPMYKILPLSEEDAHRLKLKREHDEAKLMVSLFEKGRYAIFLKTAKDFLKEYPESRYEEIVRYMMGDTYYKFWKESNSPNDFDVAMAMYRGASEKFKDSPLAARTHLFVAYSYLERGDSFGAIQAFQRFLNLKREDKNFDQKKLASQVRIAEARAFQNLSRLDDAFKILDEVEKTAPDKKDVVTAAFYKGDIFFQVGDYKRSVQEYKSAQSRYPKEWPAFPNAIFNTAESYFWLGEHRYCLDTYREFLQKFPNDEYGGYAMTRIGEVLNILGADPKRVRGAYLESNFRYRNTPGGELAKIRQIADRIFEMKDKELKHSLAEVKRIKKEVDIPGLDEFTTFLIADGYFHREDYMNATNELIQFYQSNPIAKNRDKFKARIERNITTSIRKNAEQKKFLEALQLYGHYASNWLNNSGRIDTEFYVGRAYEQAGVFKESDRIYRATLNKIYAIQGTIIEKERSVFEILPTTDAVNLRLAVTSTQNREFARAFDYLKEIKNPEKLTEEEQVERAQVSAGVFEERGDLVNSKKFLQSLVDTWRGQPITVAPIYLRLAQINNQNKNFSAAETNLAKIINLQNDTALVPEDTYTKALELRGDLELVQNRKREAVKSFQELLTQFESKRSVSSVRYKLGQALFDLGEFNEAQNTWAKLQGDKNDKNGTWFRLASEKMASAKWKKEYKKYIDRIPAMADRAPDANTKNSRQ